MIFRLYNIEIYYRLYKLCNSKHILNSTLYIFKCIFKLQFGNIFKIVESKIYF